MLSKISSFQQKIVRHAEKPESMTHPPEQKQTTETCESNEVWDLVDKDFKVTIMNMFKGLKETMIKERKEDMTIVLPEIEKPIKK